jgi:hypothetical protein
MKGEKLSIYFDLPSLLEVQIQSFENTKPKVKKTVDLDGQVETSLLEFDSTGWLQELEIFREAQINKPAFVGAFVEARKENYVLFTRNEGNADGVKTFEIHYFERSDDPKKISITSNSSNSLYTSNRELELDFEKRDDQLRLRGYSIKGTQTILSQEPTNYTVVGEVLY